MLSPQGEKQGSNTNLYMLSNVIDENQQKTASGKRTQVNWDKEFKNIFSILTQIEPKDITEQLAQKVVEFILGELTDFNFILENAGFFALSSLNYCIQCICHPKQYFEEHGLFIYFNDFFQEVKKSEYTIKARTLLKMCDIIINILNDTNDKVNDPDVLLRLHENFLSYLLQMTDYKPSQVSRILDLSIAFLDLESEIPPDVSGFLYDVYSHFADCAMDVLDRSMICLSKLFQKSKSLYELLIYNVIHKDIIANEEEESINVPDENFLILTIRHLNAESPIVISESARILLPLCSNNYEILIQYDIVIKLIYSLEIMLYLQCKPIVECIVELSKHIESVLPELLEREFILEHWTETVKLRILMLPICCQIVHQGLISISEQIFNQSMEIIKSSIEAGNTSEALMALHLVPKLMGKYELDEDLREIIEEKQESGNTEISSLAESIIESLGN